MYGDYRVIELLLSIFKWGWVSLLTLLWVNYLFGCKPGRWLDSKECGELFTLIPVAFLLLYTIAIFFTAIAIGINEIFWGVIG